MKIRFRILAAGLLLCPVALTGARAETASRSGSQNASTQRADAAKKKPAAKPADAKKPAATSAKPKTSPQTAKASVKAPAKPSTKNSDTDKPKAAVASAKKSSSSSSSSDKTKEKENTKTKAVASTAKPSAKPGKSSSKTEKPAPEKTVAKAQTGKKKTSAADDNDRDNDTPASASVAGKKGKSSAAGSRSAAAAALTAKNGKAGKNSKTTSRNADADDDQDAAEPSVSARLASESSANLPPSPPPLFVPTGLGLRFMGMPTGLPDVGSPTTALLNMAMLKTPAAGPRAARPSNAGSVAAPAVSRPAAPVKLIDPQTAKAAMLAQAGKQSAFRPALADASARRSSLPQMEEEPAPTLAYLTGPVAFVTKGAPPMADATADNFWGSADNWMFNHSAVPAASKASGSASGSKAKGQGKTKGGAVMASNTVSTNTSASPTTAANAAATNAATSKGTPSQIKSRPLPTAVPASTSTTVSSASNAAPEKPEPLASKPSLASPEMPAALAKAAAVDRAGDLSERERAFVRSLNEAADRVEHSHDLTGRNGAHAASDAISPATTPAASAGGSGGARSMPVSSNGKAATSGTAAFVLTGGDSAPAASSPKTSPKAPAFSTGTTVPVLHLTEAETAGGIQHPPAASPAAAAAPADRLPEALPAFAAAPTGKVDIQSEGQTEYDQVANKVIYTGKVELNSKAVRLRGDHVEVFLKDGGGIERLEASGHVVLRTQATAKSSGHMASAGKAVYDLTTGEITLSDWPKIQGDSKSHASTSATTVMVLKADGRALTQGPNRTLISN